MDNIPDVYPVGPLGLEPRMMEPESTVLPITPRANLMWNYRQLSAEFKAGSKRPKLPWKRRLEKRLQPAHAPDSSGHWYNPGLGIEPVITRLTPD